MVNPAQDWPDFTRAMLLVGVDASGDPVGILVDEDGNLNCILRGQGATGLQTIAVDENGRIEVFILDQEDQWGNVRRVGNAELAARLGSPVTWDWRGNVLMLNTFGAGRGAITPYESGTGSSVVISPTTFLSDGFSLHCEGGDAAEDYAGYDGRLGVNPADRFGFAIGWAPDGLFRDFAIGLWINISGTGYFGSIKWTRANYDLEYMDSDGNYQLIADATAPTGTWAFSRVKLVVDLVTKKYVRVLWNSKEYDLSAFALRSVAGVSTGTLQYQLRVYPGGAAQTGIYVDHHIVTVNEPEN